MPYKKLLWEMVESVEGAKGAVFLDSECEYVQYVGFIDTFKQKLMGAYQGILLSLARQSMERLRAGNLDKLVSEYDTAVFITANLKSNYYVVLVLEKESNIGQGLNAIARISELLNQDIC